MLIFVTGTMKDELEITNFFKKELEYEVIPHTDCSRSAFIKYLSHIKHKLSNGKGYNRFVCFVLSHGDKVN